MPPMVLRDSIFVSNGGPNAFNVAQGGAQEGGRGWVSQLEVGAAVKKVSVVVGSSLMTSDFPWLRDQAPCHPAPLGVGPGAPVQLMY